MVKLPGGCLFAAIGYLSDTVTPVTTNINALEKSSWFWTGEKIDGRGWQLIMDGQSDAIFVETQPSEIELLLTLKFGAN